METIYGNVKLKKYMWENSEQCTYLTMKDMVNTKEKGQKKN